MVKIILWKHLSRFRFALVLISWIFSLAGLGSKRLAVQIGSPRPIHFHHHHNLQLFDLAGRRDECRRDE